METKQHSTSWSMKEIKEGIKIKEEFKKHIAINETTHNFPKPMECIKSSSKSAFIAMQAYLTKQEKSQINNLTFHLKELGKEQTKSKVNRRKEIIKIKAEVNEIETKKEMENINETKSWFFKKTK